MDDSLLLESFDKQDCIDAFLKEHPFWIDVKTIDPFIYEIDVYFDRCPDIEYDGILVNPNLNFALIKKLLIRFKRWALKGKPFSHNRIQQLTIAAKNRHEC